MSGIIPQSKLSEEMLDIGFLRATHAQIAKDFKKVNTLFRNSFEADVNNFEELLQQVSVNLSKQMEIGERETLQLMYTIDFPENKFLSLTTQPDFISQLSVQLIYREAYKVWLRRNFS